MRDRTPQQEAAAADTSALRLLELASTNTELARIVARNYNATTSIELLHLLANSEDFQTRSALLTNPNFSIDLLRDLDAKFFDRRSNAPALKALLLANPTLVTEIPGSTLIALMTLAEMSPHELASAADSSDLTILMAIANHPSADRHVLTKLLAKDWDRLATTIKKPICYADSDTVRQNSVRHNLRIDRDLAQISIAIKLHINCSQETEISNWQELAERELSTYYSEQRQLIDFSVDCWDTMNLVLLDPHPNELISALSENIPDRLKSTFDSWYLHLLISNFIGSTNDENDRIYQLLTEHPRLTLNNFYDAIVRRPDVSLDLLRQLASNPEYESCHRSIAENEIAPPDVLAVLAEEGDEDVRLAVATHQQTLATTLVELVIDEDIKIRSAVAAHPHTPVEILRSLAADLEVDVRRGVASNPNTPVSWLVKLAKDLDDRVRSGVAENANTPIDLFWQLAKDEDEWVRAQVAENFNAPIDLLIQLATDRSMWVRASVASNLSTPVVTLKQLAKDKDKNVRHAVVCNPNAPTKLLAKLVNDPSQRVRCGIAEHHHTSLATLIKLLKLADWPYYRVTATAIANPKIPLELLTKLARKKNSNYRSLVADSSSAPPELFSELANDEKTEVRSYVARNPNTPPEILIQLATQDRDDYVRQTAMFFNINTPKNDRLKLLSIERIAITPTPSLSRLMALSHPDVPIAALEQQYRSILWLERYQIAQHPKTPTGILQKLALDANRVVRSAAIARLEMLALSRSRESEGS